jgi:PilZ domain-containing protein
MSRTITGVTLRVGCAAVSCEFMAFNALLMCREEQSLSVVAAALDELEIEREIWASAPEAMELMVQGRYSALVLDFDLPGAALVARLARLAAPHRRPVIFATIGALTGVAGTFQAGANFVFYKPLGLEQVRRSLRAGRVFMQPDRRRSRRQELEALVYLQFGIAALPAIVLDFNEQGLALQAPEPLPPVSEVPLRFVLPGTTRMVEGVGEVIWVDDSGRVGMLFSQLTPASRKYLKTWLSKRDPRRKNAVRAISHSDRPGISSPAS